MNRLRTLTHPALLLLFTLISVALWMPFGMGYYGVPWETGTTRVVIPCFTFGFVAFAATGCFCALRPRLAAARLVVASISLVVAVFGVVAMFWWMGRYVRPMRQQKKPATVGIVRPNMGTGGNRSHATSPDR